MYICMLSLALSLSAPCLPQMPPTLSLSAPCLPQMHPSLSLSAPCLPQTQNVDYHTKLGMLYLEEAIRLSKNKKATPEEKQIARCVCCLAVACQGLLSFCELTPHYKTIHFLINPSVQYCLVNPVLWRPF